MVPCSRGEQPRSPLPVRFPTTSPTVWHPLDSCYAPAAWTRVQPSKLRDVSWLAWLCLEMKCRRADAGQGERARDCLRRGVALRCDRGEHGGPGSGPRR
jgi:hypothetical protein